ncbi:MAG: hypothetical protein M1828_004259 [Chrysothrix sp. TS-e1954]|nr:MAG: hypothetical protein M1828_004259 [Chrysothrix sp. TS-e1954]
MTPLDGTAQESHEDASKAGSADKVLDAEDVTQIAENGSNAAVSYNNAGTNSAFSEVQETLKPLPEQITDSATPSECTSAPAKAESPIQGGNQIVADLALGRVEVPGSGKVTTSNQAAPIQDEAVSEAVDNTVDPINDVKSYAENENQSQHEKLQDTQALLDAFQKKQKAKAIARKASIHAVEHVTDDEDLHHETPVSADIVQQLRKAKKVLRQLQDLEQDTTEQEVIVHRLELELRRLQTQEKLDQDQELEDLEENELDADENSLFVSDNISASAGKRQAPYSAGQNEDSFAKRTRTEGLSSHEAPFSYTALAEEDDEHVSDSFQKPRKSRSAGKKREPAGTKSKNKGTKSTEGPKNGKRTSKKQQHRANLLSTTGNLGGGSLFQHVRDNQGRVEQPTFGSHKQSEAYKTLIASIPEEGREEAKYDWTALREAARKFGTKRCTPQTGNDAWILKGMKSSLSHYQMLGASFMVERERVAAEPKGGILADAMGLGKTVMSLAVIVNHRPPGRSSGALNTTLIVTPASITFQWLEEIHNHVNRFDKGQNKYGIGLSMRYSRAMINAQPDPVGYMATHDIVVTTYAEVLGSYPKAEPPIELQTAQEKDAWWRNYFFEHRGHLHAMRWRRIILDEATAIKNHTSWTSKACLQLQAEYRWVLSGTPAMNSLVEFYSYFKFLRVPNNGSIKVFKRNFLNDTVQGPERLQTFLRPFMLRRTHESTMFGAKLLNLPKPTRHTLVVHFSELEKQIYDVVRRRFILMINNFARAGELRKKYSHLLTLLLRLRQLAAHPLLIQDSIRDLLQPEDFEELKRITDSLEPVHLDQRALIKHLRRMLQSPRELVPLEPGSPDVPLPAFDTVTDSASPSTGETDCVQSASDSQTGGNVQPNIRTNAISQEASASKTDGFGGGFGLINDLPKYLAHLEDQQDETRMEELYATCGRCQKRARDPHVTSCQHTYCNECLMQMSHDADHGSMTCIVCNTAFTGVQVYETGDELKSKQPNFSSNTPTKASTRAGTAQPNQPQKKRPSPKEIVETWVDATGNMLPSAKTIAVKSQLLNWLAEEPKPKVVVYSQFRTIIIILRKMCHMEGWNCIEFHGSMSMDARNKAVKRFAASADVNIMLASLKTGGVGLNLSFASRVLVVDLWWNSAVEEQAFCRTYRRGQERETFLTRLAVQGTIDIDIVKMQERKEKEIDSVITANQKAITAKELLQLFGPLGEDANGNAFVHVDSSRKHGGGGETYDREIEEDDEEAAI